MPEGHLLHHIARLQRSVLLGQPLRASSPQGRFADGAATIDGRRLLEVDAYGKHLFHRYGDVVLHVHLGRLGTFAWTPAPVPPARPAVRLRLESARGAADLIAPIVCALGDPALVRRVVSGLGPDPLADAPDVARVRRAVATDGRPIGAVLLDQSVVAGVGNVLRSEVLFLIGLDPLTPASQVEPATFDQLWSILVETMRRAADAGRIVTRPDSAGSFENVRERDGRWVYRRTTCARCGTDVDRPVVGGRMMYRCPVDQRGSQSRSQAS